MHSAKGKEFCTEPETVHKDVKKSIENPIQTYQEPNKSDNKTMP
jgi:hypothetical protein